ncbi:acyl-CoA-like ligand-binding transcription factor [Micromonospora rubida]
MTTRGHCEPGGPTFPGKAESRQAAGRNQRSTPCRRNSAPGRTELGRGAGHGDRRPPALRRSDPGNPRPCAHRDDMTARFITVAAEVLAARAGRAVDDPEPQSVAAALIGL